MKRILMGMLSVILVFSLTACSTNADDTSSQKQATTTATNNDTESTGNKLMKDETVYVLCDSKGDVNKVIVSDWLQNGTESKSITDKTELNDVEVVKGNATYKMNDENMTVWDSDGGDIYYQGTSDKVLPVDLSVSYKLDGKSISIDDLTGKSGKVTIRFDYDNNVYTKKTINGKSTNIYVPFTMLTGMMLDNETFSNIKVSNGKIVNINGQSAVIGFALPKMNENLNLSKDDLEIPDYIEVTADVKDFSLGTTMTLATNEMFNDLDLSKVDDINDLEDQMDKLTDAMSQLIDGSSELYENMGVLLSGSQQILTEINQLTTATSQLKDGSVQLYNGSISLRDNLNTLQSGLGQLTKNNTILNNGAKQVFETLLSTANTQLAASYEANKEDFSKMGLTSMPTLTINNYDTKLAEVLKVLNADSVYTAYETEVKKQVNSQKTTLETTVEKTVYLSYLQYGIQSYMKTNGIEDQNQALAQLMQDPSGLQTIIANMDADTKQAVYTNFYGTNISGNILNEEKQKELTSTLQTYNDYINLVSQLLKDDSTTQSIIKEYQTKIIDDAVTEGMNSQKDNIKADSEKISAGAGQIAELRVSLNSYQTFYEGLLAYTAGVEQAYEGSKSLYEGSSSLAEGLKEAKDALALLDDGVKELQDGATQLTDGASKLKDGSMQLSDGIKQLNEEGIQKIVDLADNVEVIDRMDAIVEVSKSYNNYSGINDSMDGTVKFIYKTDEVSK